MMDDLVIIGGGQAAASLIAKLRSLGDDRAVTLVAEEPVIPYRRPPLSKKYLLGEMEPARLSIRPQQWYQNCDVTLRLGLRAEAIDHTSSNVLLSNGERLTYGHLALTTGSTPIRLPCAAGGSLPNVHTLRSLADIDAITRDFGKARSVLVVGGGYIGLEVAAVAASRGMTVTVVEMAERILQRVASPETSDYFRALHRKHGVRLLEGTALRRFHAADGRARHAEFDTGEIIDIDCSIVGIGIRSNDELAADAGLETRDGILVDGGCRTTDPRILAAGDCTRFVYHGTRVRLESVQNATDQAAVLAAALTGQDVVYQPTPWFWSDQYDVKLQIAGLNFGYDSTVVRPSRQTGAQSVWYFQGDTLLAVDAMNDAATYILASRLIASGCSPSSQEVLDTSFDLKQYLPTARLAPAQDARGRRQR